MGCNDSPAQAANHRGLWQLCLCFYTSGIITTFSLCVKVMKPNASSFICEAETTSETLHLRYVKPSGLHLTQLHVLTFIHRLFETLEMILEMKPFSLSVQCFEDRKQANKWTIKCLKQLG